MIRVQREPFDAGAETQALGAGDPRAGGIATFIGRVRGDDGLLAMTLEHYPGMTEKVMEEIEGEARARWPVLDVRIVHRTGRLEAGEAIVFVGAAATHRHDAFAAAHYVMDQVKTRAAFWKKEHRAEGDRWVEAAKADDEAAERWSSAAQRPQKGST
jgi:molybdopterin synthase catalytic subunit